MGKNTGINKATDNSFKVIFGEPVLFVQFIRDFIDIDLLKGIEASDIEDVTERFLPLFEEGKDSDTVKKINIQGDLPLFVIAILEAESHVNFRASFKMLQYITLVLDNYEKESEKVRKGASRRKGFRYPPILPIVYYDGAGKWTAETNFFDKTELNQAFGKYIPKFEYEVINLNTYSREDLMSFADAMSLILLVDKCAKGSDFRMLSELPDEYFERLELNIPANLAKLLSDATRTLLTGVNVPKDEIDQFSDKIYEREVPKMFEPLKKYDVQETRRIARAEGKAEGKEDSARSMKADGVDIAFIAKYTGLSVAEIEAL
ncbi:MAG: Rpn family recombination-promoting nuclease/putative transposase [Clostridiales Family XIII bacterium]|nr:Rpn family recombination-promoting nuclease/putative transposase [Clostridiales Family XIII bacterium]